MRDLNGTRKKIGRRMAIHVTNTITPEKTAIKINPE
jgi:hypothetical protein